MAVCGSLRAESANKSILEAALRCLPKHCEPLMYDGLLDLANFNPDTQGNEPDTALELKNYALISDAFVFAIPEYAHGIPGAFKNMLDWLVTSGEMIYKPISILNCSPYSQFAPDQLREVLRAMDTRVIETACESFPFRGKSVTADDILQNQNYKDLLSALMLTLVESIPESRREIAEKS